MMDATKLREVTDEAKQGIAVKDCGNSIDADDCGKEGIKQLPNTAGVVKREFIEELAFWDLPVNSNSSESVNSTHESVNSTQVIDSSALRSGKTDNWFIKLVRHAVILADHLDQGFSKVGAQLMNSHAFFADWGDVEVLDLGKKQEEATLHEDQCLQTLDSAHSRIPLEGPELELHIARHMERHIRQQISRYLRLLKPITFELVSMFEELNMNDPSKV
ncbi:hypothetical protein HJC23_012240 [Cyclotella cryptica]|uniref:Uncharacterized protein n=1 Tax=Cyclotella cryptica TaxID=29204 RepID=A0ABD3PP50_9STRA